MSDIKPRVGFAFSTKERVAFSQRCLASLDHDTGFDLIWVDGSDSAEAKSLPDRIRLRNCRVIEVHRDVKGGPDSAIRFGLRRLLELGFEYCGLIENDIEFTSGWYPKLMELFELGANDGLEVGSATVRTFSSRTLFQTPRYAVSWNTGAGMVLFTREAARLVLATYSSPTARQLRTFYNGFVGIDLQNTWELFMGKPDRDLGCDWAYSMNLYRFGLSSLASVPALAFIFDQDAEATLQTSYVKSSAPETQLGRERLVALVERSRQRASRWKREAAIGASWLMSAVTGNRYLRYAWRAIHKIRNVRR